MTVRVIDTHLSVFFEYCSPVRIWHTPILMAICSTASIKAIVEIVLLVSKVQVFLPAYKFIGGHIADYAQYLPDYQDQVPNGEWNLQSDHKYAQWVIIHKSLCLICLYGLHAWFRNIAVQSLCSCGHIQSLMCFRIQSYYCHCNPFCDWSIFTLQISWTIERPVKSDLCRLPAWTHWQ